MGKEKKMGKFKVGDKVMVYTAKGWVNGTVVGCYKFDTGYLVEVPDGYGWDIVFDDVDRYKKLCGAILKVGKKCYWNAYEPYMKLLNQTEKRDSRPKRRIVIEITDDGAEAKYIVGKNIEKTASVKRYIEDMPDDRLAAHYVVGKLFGQKVTKDNVDMDALKNAKYDCMIARYHLDEISKVLDPFGEPDFGKVDFKF